MPLIPDIRRVIIQNERWMNNCYNDSRGIPTVGVGFNLQRADAPQIIQRISGNPNLYNQLINHQASLTDSQVGALLDITINEAINNVRQFIPGFDNIPDEGRQIVLADMMFNLGPTRFGQFQRMISAVNSGNWAAAANEMVNSAWYNQVGNRAVRDVNSMRNGGTPALPGFGGGAAGKTNKDGKDSCDGKPGKEGKDQTDKGKDAKEGKEQSDKGKDSKEGKEGKEGKDQSDKGKDQVDKGKDDKDGKEQIDKGKDSKDNKDQPDKGKESKDDKEDKEGKDQSDKGKEGKDGKDQSDKGKDSKDEKEGKEGKDGKDQSDKGKDEKDDKDKDGKEELDVLP